MDADKLRGIVEAHGKWLRGVEGGARANLARADLADANLTDANLARAYLAGAYLAGADLAGADLAGADLAGAYLAGARNLDSRIERTDPPAPYVRNADPKTIAEQYRQLHPEVPVIPDLDARILEAVTVKGGSLEMSSVHACATTHCRAGWTTTIAGEAGAKLEAKYGWRRAASMIYRASTGRVPHFYATNERALEDIKACAAEQEAASNV